jgi:hypothetical protein
MKKSLSLLSANLLFALTMVLVISLGSAVQSVNLGWGLIATEVFIIALPTILFLSQQHVPLAEGLRLKPLPPLTGAACVLLGIALFFFGLLIEGIMAQLTGQQSVPLPENMLPKTAADMVAYFAALAIFAPLCEEMLFRGAVQGAYESRKSAGFAISLTALLFAFYHFRLSGLPGLLPIAFVLSYVVWRTGSIYAGMLIHFGNNGSAALQSILYFSTGKGLPFISLWSALGGLLVTIVLLVVITRLHPQTAAVTPAEVVGPAVPVPPPSRPKPWLATYWPLFIAGVLYFGVAGLTAVNSLIPKPAPASEIQYGMPILRSPVESHYIVTNEGGQTVGEMDCTLKPASIPIQLDCTRTIRAFEYTSKTSYYNDGNHTDSIRASWDSTTMELVSFAYEKKYEDGSHYRYVVNDGQLASTDPTGTQMVDLPQNVLTEFEWAWHAALLKANSGQSFRLPFAYLMNWDNELKKAAPEVKNLVLRVFDDETLALPQGNVTARKMTLASQSAWVAREDALAGIPRPAKFDDGMFVYLLGK